MDVVALITDLIFATKVKSTAEALGKPVKLVRSMEKLSEALAEKPALALIDMNADGVDVLSAVRACKQADPPVRVVAFLSHVQRELAQTAAHAGADVVLPRSKFSADLPALLSGR